LQPSVRRPGLSSPVYLLHHLSLSQIIPPNANNYVTKGWNVRRPTRRYTRDPESPSLAEQLTSFWDTELLGTEIPCWSGEHPDQPDAFLRSIMVSLREGPFEFDGMDASLGLYIHCVVDPVQERVKATVNREIRRGGIPQFSSTVCTSTLPATTG
jgi:hypothetical protein